MGYVRRLVNIGRGDPPLVPGARGFYVSSATFIVVLVYSSVPPFMGVFFLRSAHLETTS